MYVVIRRFRQIRSMPEVARRAESGIGQILKQCPGFQSYVVFDAGDGVGGSVALFETREGALDANEKVSTWVRGSLVDFINGEPDVIVGEVLAAVTP
ncbi:MAG: hypothetical protein ABW026_02065 [Microvirga sp.]